MGFSDSTHHNLKHQRDSKVRRHDALGGRGTVPGPSWRAATHGKVACARNPVPPSAALQVQREGHACRCCRSDWACMFAVPRCRPCWVMLCRKTLKSDAARAARLADASSKERVSNTVWRLGPPQRAVPANICWQHSLGFAMGHVTELTGSPEQPLIKNGDDENI